MKDSSRAGEISPDKKAQAARSHEKTARSLVRQAAKAGRIAPEALPAALSLAQGIERLEDRYTHVYASLVNDEACSIKGLDELAKCEKTLLECKLRLYAFLGLGPGEREGEVKIVLDGFETPQQ